MSMDIEKEIGKVLQKLSSIETKLDTALSDLADHETRLRALENKSGLRWDSLVGDLIKLLVAAFVGYYIAQI